MSARSEAAEASIACRVFSSSCVPGGERLFGVLDGELQGVDLLHRLENLVRQHAAGHFGRGDLLDQRLIFLVAARGVELDSGVDHLLLARLEIELLAIDRHLRFLDAGAGLVDLGLELGDVRLAGPNLLRAPLDAIAELRQLLMKMMQLTQRCGGDCHREPPWCFEVVNDVYE